MTIPRNLKSEARIETAKVIKVSGKKAERRSKREEIEESKNDKYLPIRIQGEKTKLLAQR